MASVITVTIPNWSKFNPRSDRANHSWLRLENDFFIDERVVDLSPREKMLYLFCLCEASRKGAEQVRISVRLACAILSMDELELCEAFGALVGADLVETDIVRPHDTAPTPAGVKAEASLHTTNERTNVTNETERERASVRDAAAQKPPVVAAPPPDARRDKSPYEHPLLELWHLHSGALPKPKGCTVGRLRAARALWAKNSDREYWRGIIERIASSGFCGGDNDRAWVADVDWFLNPDTHTKVLEGKYDNRSTGPGGGPVHPEIAKLRAEAEAHDA